MKLVKIVGLATDCLMLRAVCSYYEQTWIKWKTDDLADHFDVLMAIRPMLCLEYIFQLDAGLKIADIDFVKYFWFESAHQVPWSNKKFRGVKIDSPGQYQRFVC